MSRRALVGLAMLLAGIAVVLMLASRHSPEPSVPRSLASPRNVGSLRVSVPQALHSYDFRGGIYPAGTRPPVIGHLLTDVRLPVNADIWNVLEHWAADGGSGPPANGVVLVLRVRGMGPVGPDALHLPLTLGQPSWFQSKRKDGSFGFRYGLLRFHAGDYDVLYWSGPDAPAKDRAAVLRALESIRPAR